jgi:hypothetical protein
VKTAWIEKGILFLFIWLSFQGQSCAQKYILIERYGNPKTTRIAMYDELTFKLKDDKAGWYTRQILDMDPQGQMVLLGDAWVPLHEISYLRMSERRLWATILGSALQIGGVSMFVGDLWFTATNQPEYSEDGMLFGIINIVAGTLIKVAFGPVKYKLGKKKRLRVVDLTF